MEKRFRKRISTDKLWLYIYMVIIFYVVNLIQRVIKQYTGIHWVNVDQEGQRKKFIKTNHHWGHWITDFFLNSNLSVGLCYYGYITYAVPNILNYLLQPAKSNVNMSKRQLQWSGTQWPPRAANSLPAKGMRDFLTWKKNLDQWQGKKLQGKEKVQRSPRDHNGIMTIAQTSD